MPDQDSMWPVQGSAARTVRVHLADAPTDVLVWLVERPAQLWWSIGHIAAATAPDDADHARATVANAPALLRTMGYVVQNQETGFWPATADGQSAVTKARSDLHITTDGASDATCA